MLDHDEIVRLYGPWQARTPQDAAELFAGYDRPWWIAGGWAIEAFTGVPRDHGDVDPSIPRSDIGALRRHLAGRLDVWEADSGTLRPLLDGDDEVTDECENLWLRPSGAEPWEYDVILMHTTPTTWTFKRDARISRPLAEILWERDGIRYLGTGGAAAPQGASAAAPGPGRLRRVRPAARRTRAGVAPRRAGAGAPRPPVAREQLGAASRDTWTAFAAPSK